MGPYGEGNRVKGEAAVGELVQLAGAKTRLQRGTAVLEGRRQLLPSLRMGSSERSLGKASLTLSIPMSSMLLVQFGNTTC